ncbi:response regulator transcription factor [Paraburkholderia panacisoli]|uniref:Response regulator transcription factor n=1 Tax=Paraburkholderia panacisoli TaxID=2603818 RepID=A0A5B0GI47_9BURK|nr:response regulator transcription factor [Paraburkholderia panacisoli]KAA1001710.1 response regulator transcription factor [Paraburkholderia panacisoli]
MTRRAPHDDEQEFAFWRSEPDAETGEKKRILIGHQDVMIRESLAFLLSAKGYETIHASTIGEIRRYLQFWKPHALLFDTRLDSAPKYAFVRRLRADDSTATLLILAMSDIWPLDSIPALRSAGFDGHVRRPGSLWRIIDLVEGHYRRP